MDEFSSAPSSLNEVTQFIECHEMWREYAAVAKRIKDGQDVSTQDANFCSVAVGALLLYSSWQRPGAVEHCTLNEFKARKTEKRQDGTETIVIAVKNHKTALKGPAKLVFGAVDLEKLLLYADVVRRYLDPNNSSPYLFVRHGGGQLTQLSNRIKAVGYSKVATF